MSTTEKPGIAANAVAKQAFEWKEALSQTYQDFAKQAIEHIPQLMGAFALLVVGWFIAWLLRMLTRKLFRGLDLTIIRSAQQSGIDPSQVRSYAKLVGNIVFWSVMLFFVTASAHMLDWQIFSGIGNTLLTYLPRLLTGLVIILAGFAVSGVVRSITADAAESAGIDQPAILARIAQVTVILTTIVIGIEQLGINVTFLTTTLIVIGGVLLAGAALAFGLGAKHFVANVIGAQTTRRLYDHGQLVRIGELEGRVLEITPTTVIIDTDSGRASVPAKLFHEQISQAVSEKYEDT